MEKRTREILALVLLAALLVIGSIVIVWYIFVGHGWNMAASHIDDIVGSMEGYTVVVYEGTETPPVESHERAAKEPVLFGAESAVAAAVRADAEAEAARIAEARAKQAAEAARRSGDASGQSTSPDITVNPNLTDEFSARKPQISDKTISDLGSIVESMPEPVDIDKVCESYRNKGAIVIKVRTDDVASYSDPVVVSRGGTRYGIFYALGHHHYFQAWSVARNLRSRAVEFVIALTADEGLAEVPLSGVSLAVFACNAGIPSSGVWNNGTFRVDAPYLGEVQAVIVAPSGVMTSKTISSL